MNLFEVLFQQGCKNGPKKPEKRKKKEKKWSNYKNNISEI